MEAFHYRYHPLALRVEEIVASGELGTLERVETALCFPLPKFSDIRYDYDLAGGATDGRGLLRGPHGPHVRRRRDPLGGFGFREAAVASRRPGDDGRAALPVGPHGPGDVLDVVVFAS